MNNLLLKIYENVIRYEKEAISMEKRITKEVDAICKPYKGKLSADELEELQDILFEIALSGEQEGFQLGVLSLIKLLIEILSIKDNESI